MIHLSSSLLWRGMAMLPRISLATIGSNIVPCYYWVLVRSWTASLLGDKSLASASTSSWPRARANSWYHPYSTHQPIPGSDVNINPQTAFSYRTHSLCTLATHFGNLFLTSWCPFGTLSHHVSCSHTLT